MSQAPEYLQSLKKESILQTVINRLTDAIKNGELKPGDKMPPEIELAESLGVARRKAAGQKEHLSVTDSARA